MQTIPYAYAKRHGALLRMPDEGSADKPRLLHRANVPVQAVAEIQRLTGVAFTCEPLSDEDFDRALSDTYEQKSGAAQRMAALWQQVAGMDISAWLDGEPNPDA
jgi:hypothetical protein